MRSLLAVLLWSSLHRRGNRRRGQVACSSLPHWWVMEPHQDPGRLPAGVTGYYCPRNMPCAQHSERTRHQQVCCWGWGLTVALEVNNIWQQRRGWWSGWVSWKWSGGWRWATARLSGSRPGRVGQREEGREEVELPLGPAFWAGRTVSDDGRPWTSPCAGWGEWERLRMVSMNFKVKFHPLPSSTGGGTGVRQCVQSRRWTMKAVRHLGGPKMVHILWGSVASEKCLQTTLLLSLVGWSVKSLSHVRVHSVCDPVDCSPPGCSFHEIFQARILEWVAISSSRGPSRTGDWTWVSQTAGRFFTAWATRVGWFKSEADPGRESFWFVQLPH